MDVVSPIPELTVVVVVGPLRERGAAAVRSVLAQEVELEVLVADVRPEDGPLPGVDDARVRRLALPASTTFAAARAAAVRAAHGRHVAFVEEHVEARPGWAAAVLAAFALAPDVAGVGTTMECRNPGCGSSDIAGLLAYGHFYPPLAAGDVTFLPGHNASYRRDALLALGDRLGALLRCDLVLQAELRARGLRLRTAPAGVLAHRDETTIRSRGRGLMQWYRLYAELRAQREEWGLARRLLYVASAPVLPLYFLAHFPRMLRRERPRWLPVLLRHLPYAVISLWVAGVGQALGLLLGRGDAEARFTALELTEPRPTRAELAAARRRPAPAAVSDARA